MSNLIAPGKTIGIFSSSRPILAEAPNAAARAVRFLERRGYRVKLGNLAGQIDHYRSGSIQARAAEFNDLLHDDSVDILMAAIGGFVSNSLLLYLDYDYLRAHPKPIVGHSDVTALLLGIYQMAGTPVYYGPNLITSLALPEEYAAQAMDALKQASSDGPYTFPKPKYYCADLINWAARDDAPVTVQAMPNQFRTVIPGRVTGRLIGGNLSTISGIFGTPYMPEIRSGDILFLENVCETVDFCERYLSPMKLSGILDRIDGLILGKHKGYQDLGTGRTEADILLEILRDRKLSVLAEFDCGHTAPILAIPIGRQAALDATEQTLTIL